MELEVLLVRKLEIGEYLYMYFFLFYLVYFTGIICKILCLAILDL